MRRHSRGLSPTNDGGTGAERRRGGSVKHPCRRTPIHPRSAAKPGNGCVRISGASPVTPRTRRHRTRERPVSPSRTNLSEHVPGRKAPVARTAATIPVGGLLLLATVALVSASAAFAAHRASSGAYLAALSTVSSLGSTVPANGDVNPYGIVDRSAERRLAARRGSADQQLQRQVEQPGHRHDDRPDDPGRAALAVRDRRRRDAARASARAAWASTTALAVTAGRVRRRRQPADHQRPVGDREGRLSDRPR